MNGVMVVEKKIQIPVSCFIGVIEGMVEKNLA